MALFITSVTLAGMHAIACGTASSALLHPQATGHASLELLANTFCCIIPLDVPQLTELNPLQ